MYGPWRLWTIVLNKGQVADCCQVYAEMHKKNIDKISAQKITYEVQEI